MDHPAHEQRRHVRGGNLPAGRRYLPRRGGAVENPGERPRDRLQGPLTTNGEPLTEFEAGKQLTIRLTVKKDDIEPGTRIWLTRHYGFTD